MARTMIVLRNIYDPPRELGLADGERIAPNTTPPASAGTPPRERRGWKKKKWARLLLLGPPPSIKLRALFLVLRLLLIFSGGVCGWLRAGRRAMPARLLRWRLPACPW